MQFFIQPNSPNIIITLINMAHRNKISTSAWLAMSSVVVVYLGLKLPLKYTWASENRLSPKVDLAWNQAAEKWLKEN